MGNLTKDAVMELLGGINYPGFNRDLVSFGVIMGVDIADSKILVKVRFTTKNDEIKIKVIGDIQSALREKYPDMGAHVEEDAGIPVQNQKQQQKAADDPWAGRTPVDGVKHIIAVASGKGGVGKSTVTTNLAIAMAQQGLKVGVMDSDIYGPSVHIMMGIDERPMVTEEQKIIPLEKYGIKMMSMGFLVDSDSPLIWRGPLVMKAVEQFLRDVIWGELDVLLIDMPPGTGDAQLTLVQKTPISGAVIVTTPQEVALVDARRGLKMFQKVETHVLGIVENMSYYLCPKCDDKSYIFGENGGAKAAEALGVPLLGQVPIEPGVTEAGDAGIPVVSKHSDSKSAQAFLEIAEKLLQDEKLK